MEFVGVCVLVRPVKRADPENPFFPSKKLLALFLLDVLLFFFFEKKQEAKRGVYARER